MDSYDYFKFFLLEDFIYKLFLSKKDLQLSLKFIGGKVTVSCNLKGENDSIFKAYSALSMFFKFSKIKFKKSKSEVDRINLLVGFGISQFFDFFSFFLKKGFQNIIEKDLFFRCIVVERNGQCVFVFKELSELGFELDEYDYFGWREVFYFEFLIKNFPIFLFLSYYKIYLK